MTTQLNEEQRRAVESGAALRLVVAGPGSGKTRMLCAAVAHEVALGTAASEVVAITFTNAGAGELERRLAKDHGLRGRLGFCGTVHAFCLSLVREHAEALGLPGTVSVADDEQREDLLETVRSEMGIKITARKAMEALERSRGEDPATNGVVPAEWLLVREYHRRMRLAGLLDFDMVLALGLRHVRDARNGKAAWPFKAVFWDEGQDSAQTDLDLLTAMPCARKLAVGDSDQAIYGFRGGSVAGFNRLAEPGSGWEVHLLESNYRSGATICDAAQHLIMRNLGRVRKWTRAVRKGGTVRAVRCETPGEELSRVLEEVQRLGSRKTKTIYDVSPDGTTLLEPPTVAHFDLYGEIAVLARTNRLADAFAQHLAANGVPVRQRKERAAPADWKRTKLLLTVLSNPWNDMAVLQLLKCSMGDKDAQRVRQVAAMKMTGVNESLGFPYGKGEGYADVDLMKHGVSPESRERVHDAARELSGRGEWSIPDLLLYLNALEGAEQEEGEGVTCTTMHGAKGREWRHVFVVGCEEGVVPSGRKGTDVEEERRLMYVAVTRAMETATLTWCAARPQSRGPDMPPGPMEPRQRSRFVEEAGL